MQPSEVLSCHVLHSESPRTWSAIRRCGSSPLTRHCSRPVVMLYGFFGIAPMLAPLAGALARRGRCVLWFDLGGWLGRFNTSPLDALAGQVQEALESVLAETKASSVDLVGHSAGGLVGRYCVQRLGGSRYVEHLLTLGTPHRGAPGAPLAYRCTGLRCLGQLAPDSDLLGSLPDDGFPAETWLTSVFSREDRLCPPAACRLDATGRPHLRNVEIATGGHLDFLFRKPAIDVVRRELGCGGEDRRRWALRDGRVSRGPAGARRHAVGGR